MNKKLLLSSLIITQVGFSQVTDGLVMDVPFTYGNVYDLVGQNHGTNNGATLTTDRFGDQNMAFYFDGSDCITFGNDVSTNTDNLDEISISVWIKPDNGFSGMRSIVSKWNNADNEQYGLYQDGLNGIYAFRNINNAGTSVTLPASIDWIHVIYTANILTNEQKLYVNNLLVSTSTPGGVYTSTISSTFLSIGAQYNDTDGMGAVPNKFFQGSIDDLKIFDRVLTVEEVDTLFNAPRAVCIGFDVNVSNITHTSSNTGSFSFIPNGGHAPYQYTINSGTPVNFNSSKLCNNVGEGGSMTLTAPAGTQFTSVNFASYGNPSGTCGSFVYDNCHAYASYYAAEDTLLGNNSGTFIGGNTQFGDPCFGTGKNSRIMASYSDIADVSGLAPGDYFIAILDSMGCFAYATVTINDLTLGVEENTLNEIMVYPNPSNGSFTIEVTNPQFCNLYTMSGELVETVYITNQSQVDFSLLQSGVYFLKSENGICKKIIIE